MQLHELKTRPAKCANRWYPRTRSPNSFNDKPLSSAVISPHAGFDYSGQVSLEAVSHVKKSRIWFFGTSHYESLTKGISIFYGNYSSSIGKTVFPQSLDERKQKIIEKYLSNEGHRTEEHSIENVLYCVNHFSEEVEAFCSLVQIDNEKDFETAADDIASVWEEGDSIVVSTDWNHFVSTKVIDRLMKDAESYLASGKIDELYKHCMSGKYEACGIDGLYLAHKVLSKKNESTKFVVLKSTDSSRTGEESGVEKFASTCVGYIAARN
jgi:AmmeMemoRadiSam system protein B